MKRPMVAIGGATLAVLMLFSALIDMVNGNHGWDAGSEEQEFVNLAYSSLSLYKRTGAYKLGCSDEEAQQLWDALVEVFDGNDYAAAGTMGNLYAESQLASDRLEGDIPYSETSKIYTAKVDSGAISRNDFIYNGPNGGGYGLAGWTWWEWKQQLYDLAKAQGKSIGDLSVHLDLLVQLLNGEKIGVLNALKSSVTVRGASDIFLHLFEKPTDQSTAVEERRASYGQFFYNKYVLAAQIEGNLTEAQKLVCYIATHSADYGITADAGYCQAWAAMCYYCAGFPVDQSPSAKASGIKYGVSNDFSVIPPGAAIYGRLNQQYGHVGIYVGDGLVYHNVGGVAVDTLDNWISYYEAFAWGWQAGTDLTLLD